MTLEQIVVTRETAEKLKAAGWTVDTALVWCQDLPDDKWLCLPRDSFVLLNPNEEVLLAPTAGELMEEMFERSAGVMFSEDRDGYDATGDLWQTWVTAPTPADALANLWLELHKEKTL
jgi:hypothetical protein